MILSFQGKRIEPRIRDYGSVRAPNWLQGWIFLLGKEVADRQCARRKDRAQGRVLADLSLSALRCSRVFSLRLERVVELVFIWLAASENNLNTASTTIAATNLS